MASTLLDQIQDQNRRIGGLIPAQIPILSRLNIRCTATPLFAHPLRIPITAAGDFAVHNIVRGQERYNHVPLRGVTGIFRPIIFPPTRSRLLKQ